MKIYRLRESKTTQLKKLLKNGNITEDQFNIADKFFKTYSAFEKEIDWNRGLKITWDDLKAVIYKERSSESKTRKKIRKGLEGFEEGKDYLVLEETDSYTAYQPFTWEASRMIASHYVEPFRNEEGEIEDANWCTAYQKDRDYWDSHNEQEAFIYLCGETIPTKKVAISISEEEEDASGSRFLYSTDSLNYNIWDFNDDNDIIEAWELYDIIPNLEDLIKKAYKNWDNTVNTIDLKYNPETGRYDYDGSLSARKLKKYIKPNKGGFTINFGKVTGDFSCSDLGLTSLKGAPQEVGGNFDCSYNQLTSLEGAPQEVGGNFDCSYNQLTSLEGALQEVGGDFRCYYNHLISLEGAPQTIGGDFSCSNNKLTSLEGAPQTVGRDFSCFSNQLTSLEGAPQIVRGSFLCYRDKLTSLKGAPQEVGENFNCAYNHLTSLEGAPQKVGGNFWCNYNPNLPSLEGIGEVKGRIYKDY